MATRPFVQTDAPLGQQIPTGSLVLKATGLLNGEDTGWYVLSNYPEKCISFHGTFGAGGTILLEGSNDPADPPAAASIVTLTDPQGTAISKTAASIEEVLENPLKVRARVSAGDGTTTLTALLLVSTTARR